MSPSFVLLLTLLFLTSITMVDAYDYFLMAVQWPPAVCRSPTSPCKVTPLPKFTISGMWPGDSINGSRLYHCPGSPYDKNLFSKKQERGLDNAWPNWRGVNSDFWDSEWTKHGRCSENNLNQVQYFAKAVEIWLRLDIDSALIKNGIYPNSRHYLTDIRSAIKRATSVDPILICKGGDKKPLELEEIKVCIDLNCKGGEKKPLELKEPLELEEIRVCIDLNDNYMQCPGAAGADSGCAQQIGWIISETDAGRALALSRPWPLIVTCFLLQVFARLKIL